MTLSIIIPIFNEEKHLTRFLETIDKLKLPVPKELILINDGSTDATAGILKSFSFESSHKIVEHPLNLGKGMAIQSGIMLATGELIGVQDADFEYSANELSYLVEPFLQERADIVYGSRYMNKDMKSPFTWHYLANKFLTKLSNLLSGLRLSDMETCYKIFRAEILQNIYLKSRRFGFEPEVTAKIAKLNVRILELPVSYQPRSRRAGKKITWRDGIAAIWHLFRFNLFQPRKKCFKSTMPSIYRS